MAKTIDELIQQLKSDDEFDVEEALGELEIRSDESFEPLLDALDNRSKAIRRYSAQALGYIGDERAIDPLIVLLEDNNKFVRREASTALVRIGEPAFDSLIGLLDHENWRVRGAAAWALGSLGKEEAIEPLEALLEDESGFVKAGAKSAINDIKNKE
jgi:HEAT repeat protein